MKLHLTGPQHNNLDVEIQITGSKSESNRSLLLQALHDNIAIANVSNSDDALVMQQGLKISDGTVDIHHAGTAMRFLTAYFAAQQGKEVTLTGSKRMTERPIKILVSALRELGADISYVQEEGYPPIQIKGRALTGEKVSLPANISSQYISALLLVAPSLPNGLTLELVGEITSIPYIKMTLGLLQQIGVAHTFVGNTITVSPVRQVAETHLTVESDWSSASYYYSVVALAEAGSTVTLSAYKKDSLQGDSILADIYEKMGVRTTFLENSIRLTKEKRDTYGPIAIDLVNAPDIAQTIAVTCFGLGIGCHLIGLHTLKIKETDRLVALHTELSKLGADISVSDKDLTLKPGGSIREGIAIDTYNDHRMAMAFAPLALKTNLFVNDAGVVSKSYPDFWDDMKTVGFAIRTV
ncbi:3-phosphoshikimate 1-carboxyvinyltransferase [Maribacter sp. 2-571]|uniref:3-phosphoshikimate 1-carboxyvinyltransferase n=1 Tax=Maribacter sp. 2-571 TaxID=3417569 RepID=UPI003D34EBCF